MLKGQIFDLRIKSIYQIPKVFLSTKHQKQQRKYILWQMKLDFFLETEFRKEKSLYARDVENIGAE